VPIDLGAALDAALKRGGVHLYLDANILIDIVRKGRHPESLELFEKALARKWRCTASTFARMEALDIEQTNKWIQQRIRAGEHPDRLLRRLRERDLPTRTLKDLQREFYSSFLAGADPLVHWRQLDGEGWDLATELALTTNIAAPDCIHVATALRAGCDILVTWDQPLEKMASERHIASANPKDLLDKLRARGY
jgi:predicted nucleic acid-binding protein